MILSRGSANWREFSATEIAPIYRFLMSVPLTMQCQDDGDLEWCPNPPKPRAGCSASSNMRSELVDMCMRTVFEKANLTDKVPKEAVWAALYTFFPEHLRHEKFFMPNHLAIRVMQWINDQHQLKGRSALKAHHAHFQGIKYRMKINLYHYDQQRYKEIAPDSTGIPVHNLTRAGFDENYNIAQQLISNSTNKRFRDKMGQQGLAVPNRWDTTVANKKTKFEHTSVASPIRSRSVSSAGSSSRSAPEHSFVGAQLTFVSVSDQWKFDELKSLCAGATAKSANAPRIDCAVQVDGVTVAFWDLHRDRWHVLSI